VRAFERTGQTLPVDLIDSVRRNKVALKGPVTTPIAQGFTSVNVGLRKALDLYSNLRPVWNLPGVDARFQGVDMVIVRENTRISMPGSEHECGARRRREPEDHHRARLDADSRTSPSSMRGATAARA
jgi:isocitrate dehydrogenase (NAD+)